MGRGWPKAALEMTDGERAQLLSLSVVGVCRRR